MALSSYNNVDSPFLQLSIGSVHIVIDDSEYKSIGCPIVNVDNSCFQLSVHIIVDDSECKSIKLSIICSMALQFNDSKCKTISLSSICCKSLQYIKRCY